MMTAVVSAPHAGRESLSAPDFLAIVRKYNDVTERLRQSHEALGREVCRLRDELHEKNRELQRRERLAALGEMAAGVAHEIRNPLGAIRLYASLLSKDLRDRPDESELVRRLEVGIRNLDGIVGDILAFAGEIHPAPTVVPVERIISDVLAQAAPQAEMKRVSLEVVGRGDGIELFCDPEQVQRALLNLVVNAMDAAEAGGRVWIRPVTVAAEGQCHVQVEDDGPGIDPALLHRVFNPFFTTKHTGTGLGLAIVHRIAEANGGRVRTANRPEGGAVFVLSVPLRDSGGG